MEPMTGIEPALSAWEAVGGIQKSLIFRAKFAEVYT